LGIFTAFGTEERAGGFGFLHAPYGRHLIKTHRAPGSHATESRHRQRTQVVDVTEAALEPDHRTDIVAAYLAERLLHVGLLNGVAHRRGRQPQRQHALRPQQDLDYLFTLATDGRFNDARHAIQLLPHAAR